MGRGCLSLREQDIVSDVKDELLDPFKKDVGSAVLKQFLELYPKNGVKEGCVQGFVVCLRC